MPVKVQNTRCCIWGGCHPLQEVFLTAHHLGVALEYADGGDLSEYIDNHAQNGVRLPMNPPRVSDAARLPQ